MAAQGAKISADEILDAQMKRGALGLHMNLFHRDYDLLLTPTLSIAAFDAGKEVADKMLQSRWTDWTPFSFPFNLTQQPAASIPCGLTRPACRSACTSSARATPTRWCCAPRRLSKSSRRRAG